MLQHLKVRPHLTAALVLTGIIHFFLLPENWRTVTRLLTAWDFGIFLYLILISVMMNKSGVDTIRSRAAEQDEGALIILVFTILTVMASVVAIVEELATAKAQHANTHIMLTAITIVLSWLFMQTMFALHYTHKYYNNWANTKNNGLKFPDENLQPDYWDFIYFSFIIGTAAQTADINITSKSFRRLVTLHCFIVFFFNMTILALTINIGASLLSAP
ncbi:MAG: DUF1345 domain-containing protein [Methylococcales bacterium]|nr:DUF1345 domain-containing protein [Methylococcales bacterium]MDP3839326.1 DUF1345 domain-containing protein [Methylococcales bacterium]